MSTLSSIMSSTESWDKHHNINSHDNNSNSNINSNKLLRRRSSESSNWSMSKAEKEIADLTLLGMDADGNHYEDNEGGEGKDTMTSTILNDCQLLCTSPTEMSPPYYRISDFLSCRPGKEESDSTATLLPTNITIRDWSRANLRILTQLLQEDPTVAAGYLRYTDHIYSFPAQFSWSTLMAYDDVYRRAQATEGFKWGTRMSLVYLHYHLGASHPGRVTPLSKSICERYNLQRCVERPEDCPKKRRHCCLGCQRDYPSIQCPYCLKDKAKREVAWRCPSTDEPIISQSILELTSSSSLLASPLSPDCALPSTEFNMIE